MLVENLLVIMFRHNKSDYLSVCHDRRRSLSRIELVRDSFITYHCIRSDRCDSSIVLIWMIMFPSLVLKDIHAVFSTVDDIHAVSDFTLVHHRFALGEDLALKLLNKCTNELFRITAEEGNPEFQVCLQMLAFFYLTIFGANLINKISYN